MASRTDPSVGQDDLLTNEQVRSSIIHRLEDSPHHELRQVHVDVNAERILLTGTVATFFMKQLAQETALQACSARKVSNHVEVT